jgi:hypothetical protein
MSRKSKTVMLAFALSGCLPGAGPYLTVVAATPTAPTTPAAAAATKSPQPAKKVVYELPKTGVNKPRPGGGFINVETSGTRLRVKFFDKLKKPVPPNVERGMAIFKYASRNPARAPLSVDGAGMTTPAVLRPPHNFVLLLSLFAAGKSDAEETYSFQYP